MIGVPGQIAPDLPVLVLRPQPGADATAARARAIGLDPVILPLFLVEPLSWQAPDPAGFDALMLSSANAARHGGAQLQAYRALPLYAVGPETAAAARAAGLSPRVTGSAGASVLTRAMAADGVGRALWLCGAERTVFDSAVALTPCPVYRSVETAPPAFPQPAIALVHSARAARRLSAIHQARAATRIVAISTAVADAAGSGWASVEAADGPNDDAMLALAARLCKAAGDR